MSVMIIGMGEKTMYLDWCGLAGDVTRQAVLDLLARRRDGTDGGKVTYHRCVGATCGLALRKLPHEATNSRPGSCAARQSGNGDSGPLHVCKG